MNENEEALITRAQKAINTTMIGAVVEIEDEFSRLVFKHGFDAKALNESFAFLRNRILDCGNAQIRKLTGQK